MIAVRVWEGARRGVARRFNAGKAETCSRQPHASEGSAGELVVGSALQVARGQAIEKRKIFLQMYEC